MKTKPRTPVRLIAVAALVWALSAAAGAQAFRHPGVVVSGPQLAFLKKKIDAGEEPWKSAFARLKSSSYASLTMTPRPRASVDCGAYSSPNNGCSEELNDAWSAYTQALLWSFTGKEEHAKKAVQILNAWSATLKTHTGHNAPLQSGWAASISVRASEIIKHTYAAWPKAESDRWGEMLRKAYMPYLLADIQHYNGNWLLTMLDAAMGIGVHLDDRTIFEDAVTAWRKRTPAYIYVTEDGPTPVPPPPKADGSPSLNKTLVAYWYNQKTYQDGVAQETCRDLGHTGYGFGSMGTAAETALLQNIDLYAEQEKRIMAGFEFHADFLAGKAVPSWLCGGSLDKRQMPTWEIVYNHYVNRRGKQMPLSKKLIETRIRPAGVDKHMAWETLTHANTGSAALEGAQVSIRSLAAAPAASMGARLVLGRDGVLRLVRPGPNGAERFFALDGARLK